MIEQKNFRIVTDCITERCPSADKSSTLLKKIAAAYSWMSVQMPQWDG
jgi:hypothetical protein